MKPGLPSFDRIVSSHGERIYRLCCAYAVNQEDRRDLHQEILLKVWKNLPSFNGSAALGTWIYRVAVNTSIDWLRRSRRDRRRMVARPVDDLEVPDATQDTESRAVGREDLRRLLELISELSFVDRTLISLYLEGLGYDEIAEVMGISAGNVGVRIHRVRTRLRNRYEGRK